MTDLLYFQRGQNVRAYIIGVTEIEVTKLLVTFIGTILKLITAYVKEKKNIFF